MSDHIALEQTSADTRQRRSHPTGPLPNPAPRPPGELEALRRPWTPPKGFRILSAVNNNYIGVMYIGAALIFFILAGILALMMRTQLAQPGLDLIGHDLYNQLFTMHGTIMMFLFAVPVVEAIGVFLLPNMQAARDLPFPRLSAYAFWAYFVGGLCFFASLFFGLAPKGGWFMYPPLTSYIHSPEINADFWLLGIGFIEISAIAGAIEIIVGIMKTRAPGQSIDKMPIYCWAMLVFALMVVFAFPAVIAATLLLELERAFHWPFFIAEKGGDPLLWQHLFWFFGHPEVYVIFLPAAGLVSMMIPAMAQAPLAAYRLVVLAIIGTGFLSFGLWVHHMFATGLPQVSIGYFSAASMAVAIPSGIQVFAWIATMASGRMQWGTPTYFLLGFLFIFVLGGLTGVMVAMVPFDWQVHDTYFIVAHLHYVLIGGMVFPIFAAFYYWAPMTSRYRLSETLGKTAFWLMFIGVNVTFFTMHITGFMGMPRRVYTYLPELGWGTLNLVSTIGAYMIAAGVAVFLFDVARNFRYVWDDNAGNVWNAGTLEWLPTSTYQTRSIPIITSREPLWEQPNLADDVDAGRYYLPFTATGQRETIVTSPITAQPQHLLILPGSAWSPLIAAVLTAAFFIGLTIKLYWPALACGVGAVIFIMIWLWDTDHPAPREAVDIGAGITLEIKAVGPVTHSYWAMIVLTMVAGTAFASFVFAYFYLWTVNPQMWPAEVDVGGGAGAGAFLPVAVALLLLASSIAVRLGQRRLDRDRYGRGGVALALIVALPLFVGAALLWGGGHVAAGLDGTADAYQAIVSVLVSWNGVFAFVLTLMALFSLAKLIAGRLGPECRATYDNTAVLWHYAVGQGIVAVAVVHGFPMLLR